MRLLIEVQTIINVLEIKNKIKIIQSEETIMTDIIPSSHSSSCGRGSIGTINIVSGASSGV